MAVIIFKRRFALFLVLLLIFLFIMLLSQGYFCSNMDIDEEVKWVSKKVLELSAKERRLQLQEERLLHLEKELNKSYSNSAVSMLKQQQSFIKDLPTIYAITPTYARCVQKAELTRLSQTFLHVRNFHWIVVEDAVEKTPLVTNFLRNCGLIYTHLNIATPEDHKLQENDPNWLKPRGVLQRNIALKWLRDNLDVDNKQGVVYFADDDNTYDLKLFDEMRSTKQVSVWPVGLVGALRYESPVVHNGKVTGWFTYWKPERPFAMDMAGFAINLQLMLKNPQANFKIRVPRGYQESELLKHLVTMQDLEPKAENCSKVLVWHTRTEKPKLKNEDKLKKTGQQSDPDIEV
ncbi:galactosylgalactosylxylosylprotein 3-beta-glucuronosyltransferase 3 isoform X1 [Lingula anatina]|uniref:Galactosylgalactosylxylosylprotein 3-beta-glucuronosyltransferase n=2 Tax=Lingula anatina TaxID=7574 RepID=A0A1S3ITE2_LINAN|nr:galactosylgalactosylxylosylprotein 3-beta-glucuronosyltransferase 3 isoform X1 [Lingula anatina]|eukprot:XP_013400799.1 galactosylgalactosylxylosylprotein 3-beta-glucuronosyltransferase 3 isoform X1 [Lingula anatina]